MRCQGTTKQGKQCRWPAITTIGGVASCQYHIHQSTQAFNHVCAVAKTDPLAAKCVATAKKMDEYYEGITY